MRWGLEEDNSNVSRLMEFQRLLAGILAAEWTVLHFPDHHELISSDLGYGIRGSRENGSEAYIIPIDRHTAIEVSPRMASDVMRPKGLFSWAPVLQHRLVNERVAHGLNEATAVLARSFIVGSGKLDLARFAKKLRRDQETPEPVHVGFPGGRLAIVHEHEWFRLVSATTYPPGDNRVAKFALDWSAIGAGWAPMVILPVNLPEFPTGLKLTNSVISLELSHVEGFSADRELSSDRKRLVSDALRAIR
jgi:hypothetical protein